MASVRESRGRLFLDYRAGGERQRAYVKLADTAANRSFLKGVAVKVEATLRSNGDVSELLTGMGLLQTGDDSNVREVVVAPTVPAVVPGDSTPLFSSFANQWFSEIPRC